MGKGTIWRERESVHPSFGPQCWQPICSQASLGPGLRSPDPVPAFAMKQGSRVSSSGYCVGSVQEDGVRGLQRLFSCGGSSDVGVLQDHRELVKMPTDI